MLKKQGLLPFPKLKVKGDISIRELYPKQEPQMCMYFLIQSIPVL
jgi:hypothetical protein